MKTEPTLCNPLLVQPTTQVLPHEELLSSSAERKKELSLKRKALFAKIPKGSSEILTGKLWLGSGRDARQKHNLMNLGITHVVNCAIEWKNHYPSSFLYFNGNVFDTENQDLSVFFSQAFDFLDEVFKEPSHRVFVHCVVGKSRSAALTIAYLMRIEHLTLKQAYNHVKLCRTIICPNDGFMRQLMALEMQIFNTATPSLAWGEWKNQSKCALAPSPSLSPESPPSLSEIIEAENINTSFTTSLPLLPLLPSSEPSSSLAESNVQAQDAHEQDKRRAKVAKRTQVQQEVLDSFVQMHITPELLQQGLREVCGGVYEENSVGTLLQWVHHGIRDSTSCAEGVRREGLSWRDVAHSIDESAKQWLRQQTGVSKSDITT